MEPVAECRAQPLAADNRRRRCVGGEASQLAARLDIREYQRRDIVAIRTGEHHVAHIGREMVDETGPQHADPGPGAGGQLEILGEPAVEQQTLAGIVRVDEFERIAQLVEAFRVKGLARERVLPPITERDVRAA